MTRSRKDCRGGEPCQPSTLAEALCCLVQHSDADVTQLAAALSDRFNVRIGRAYLYELANPYRPIGRQLAVVGALTQITGRDVLLRFLCHLNGGAYVPLPAVRPGDSESTVLAAHALRDFSEALQAFADGAADREWTEVEVTRLEREGQEAVERVLQLVAHARSRALPEKASRTAKASLESSSATMWPSVARERA